MGAIGLLRRCVFVRAFRPLNFLNAHRALKIGQYAERRGASHFLDGCEMHMYLPHPTIRRVVRQRFQLWDPGVYEEYKHKNSEKTMQGMCM